MSINVKFISQTEVKKGKTALQAAKEAKIKIEHSCDGKGKCGKCIVKIIEGEVSEPTKDEIKRLGEKKIEEGYRLACEVELQGDVTLEVHK